MKIEQSLERLEKEMPGYYIQLIPAFLSAFTLFLAAGILREEVNSSFGSILYILIFIATNFLFHKSLLRILSSFLMKQAIKDRDISVFLNENKSMDSQFKVIYILAMVLMNIVLWYVWLKLASIQADILLLTILTVQFFKGIQAKMQFNTFLKVVSMSEIEEEGVNE